MKTLKVRRSERLREELPELRKRYRRMHIWFRRYFVITVGTDSDIIQHYLQQQQEDEVKAENCTFGKTITKSYHSKTANRKARKFKGRLISIPLKNALLW